MTTDTTTALISLETISLFLGIIVPISGLAFGLGVLYTKLDNQREELKLLKGKVEELRSKLDAYLLAAEELTELRRELKESKEEKES